MKNKLSFRSSQIEDRRIINALTNVFRDNARMRALVGRRRTHLSRGIRHIIAYSYFMVKKLGGIFVAEGQHTYLLFYRKSQLYFSGRDYLNYTYLALFVIGLRRLKRVYLREKSISKRRKRELCKRGEKDYLYVWFMAQNEQAQGMKGLVEVKQFLFSRARNLNLPIYIETTEERLLQIYERIGFQFYDCWVDEERELSVWFGRFA